jgi:hypothetical protein
MRSALQPLSRVPVHPLVVRSMAKLTPRDCLDAYFRFGPMALDLDKRAEYEHAVAEDIAERVAAAIKDNEAMDNARAMLEGEKYVFMRNEKVMDVLFPDRQTSVDEAWLDVEEEDEDNVVHAMNRNARKPKKANHGARPCSRVGRRKRRYARYKKSGTKV